MLLDYRPFWQRRFQQVDVVWRMVFHLDLPVEIGMYSTVREGDGLAMSSRNGRLSPQSEQMNAAPISATSSSSAASGWTVAVSHWDGGGQERGRKTFPTEVEAKDGALNALLRSKDLLSIRGCWFVWRRCRNVAGSAK